MHDREAFRRNRFALVAAFGLAASAPLRAAGLTRQIWTGVPGNTVARLERDARFPCAPDSQETLPRLATPPDRGDRYGERIAGYLLPPKTGRYTFWIAGDDQSVLRLSADADPAHLKEICRVSAYTAPEAWTQTPEQKSGAIELEAGRRYFIEVLHKEGGGKDHVAVAWQGPGFSRRIIEGRYLAPLTGKEIYPVQAADDAFMTVKDRSVECAVLANDRTFNAGRSLRIVRFDKRSAHGGAVTRVGDGPLRYQPPAGFVGRDTFTYAASDGAGDPTTARARVAVNAAIEPARVRRRLLRGVTTLLFPTANGALAAYAPGAVSVVCDAGGRTFVAAGSWGKGRVVLFGHDAHAALAAFGDQGDTGRLYLNALAWAAGKPLSAARVVVTDPAAERWLRAHGCPRVERLRRGWSARLPDADALVLRLRSPRLRPAQQEALAEFVAARGRGVFAAGCGWRWAWGAWLPGVAANRLFAEAGLGWSNRANKAKRGDKTSQKLSLPQAQGNDLGNALNALAAIRRGSLRGKTARARAAEAIQATLSVLPPASPLRRRIGDALMARAVKLYPSPKNPIRDPLDKLALDWEAGVVASTPVDQVKPHRTAAQVYGDIPADAPRVTRTLHYRVTKPALGTYGRPFKNPWLSTGLYAAPGEIVTVTVPDKIAGKGARIRINGDWNDIRARPYYLRMPFGVCRLFPINRKTLKVANAYGGLIYIELPWNFTPGAFDVAIEHAVEAPRFVLGKTTNKEWTESLRNKPAPKGEIDAGPVIISTWSSELRRVDDMEAVARFWRDGVLAEDDLAGVTGRRTRPERIVNMVETAWGAAYASYPIGAWNWRFADLASLRRGHCWGQWHELGHLHQSKHWTFRGCVEVTVNIFTMYAIEHTCKSGRAATGWGRQWDPAYRARQFRSVRQAGGFDKVGVGQRLIMYSQLRAAFGWEPFKKVFREYLAAPPDKLPKTDRDKRDQWMVRFSRAVGRDLSPFFTAWKLGVSRRAVQSLADLRKWNMAEAAPDFLFSEGGAPVPIDADSLTTNDFSFDGVLRLVSVGRPRHGKLTRRGEGAWTYVPDSSGKADSFTYTVVNGYGDQFSSRVFIRHRPKGGLMHHWTLDEPEGAQARDACGRADGTLRGGPRRSAPGAGPNLGRAILLDGVDDAVELPALKLDTNVFTVTAWIRPDAGVRSWSGVFFCRGPSTAAGLQLGFRRELRYQWGGGEWRWNSKLVVPTGQWTFVALVVEPAQATIYVNDRRAARLAAHSPQAFGGPAWIGRDPLRGRRRYFKGAIDDVRVYLKALSKEEVSALYRAR